MGPSGRPLFLQPTHRLGIASSWILAADGSSAADTQQREVRGCRSSRSRCSTTGSVSRRCSQLTALSSWVMKANSACTTRHTTYATANKTAAVAIDARNQRRERPWANGRRHGTFPRSIRLPSVANARSQSITTVRACHAASQSARFAKQPKPDLCRPPALADNAMGQAHCRRLGRECVPVRGSRRNLQEDR